MACFEDAMPYVLANEGVQYCNYPNDPGGPTKYGICQSDHPDLDIKNLSIGEADEIYRQQYWCYDGIQTQQIATKLLDMAVNMEGTGRSGAAIRIIQQAINAQMQYALTVDGKYGPNTELMLNKCHLDLLLQDIVKYACIHYNALADANPRLNEFLHGWLTRAKRLPGA